MKTERIQWPEYFMTQALLIATRSTCPRLAVGCVLTQNNRVIATGYNGSIQGLPHCIDQGCEEDKGHCIRTIHAEVNAVAQCAKMVTEADGATAYITHYPCLQCAKVLIQAGVRQIFYAKDYKNSPHVENLSIQTGVSITKIKVNPENLLKIVAEIQEESRYM